jgi:hypothetical protein
VLQPDRASLAFSRAGCLLVALLVGSTAACDDGGPTSPTLGMGGSTLNLTGTWSGSASDALGQFQMTLVLAQSGNSITGSMTGATTVGAPIYTNGTVTGTLSASTLNFTISVPAGGVVDAPDCTASFAGTTTDLLATSMAGTYTGADTCGGTFAGGRFLLVKQ